MTATALSCARFLHRAARASAKLLAAPAVTTVITAKPERWPRRSTPKASWAQANMMVTWTMPTMVMSSHLPARSWTMLSSEHMSRSRVWFSSSSSSVPELPTAPNSRNITAMPAAYMDTTGLALSAAKRSTTSMATGVAKRETGDSANWSGERDRKERIC